MGYDNYYCGYNWDCFYSWMFTYSKRDDRNGESNSLLCEGKMTHYLITMKDGWRPGECYMCQFKCEAKFGINPSCPLANAKKAIPYRLEEIKLPVIDGYEAKVSNPKIDGKPVKLYAVEEDK